MKKRPSYCVIIREGKKKIFCENDCEHLDCENIRLYCELYNKELEGIIDNIKPCEECIKYFNSIEEIE